MPDELETGLTDSPFPDPHPPSETGEASLDSQSESPVAGLLSSDRFVLTTLSGVILLLIGVHLGRLWVRSEPAVEIHRLSSHELQYQIDINQATWVEWMQLPEIGEVMSRQIVADRQLSGPFFSVDDVDRVRGIGPATMKKIRPYLKFEPTSVQKSPQ